MKESETKVVGSGQHEVTYYSEITILKQLQNSSFRGFVLDNELTFSMFNYRKEPKDRRYFHQLDQKVQSHNVYLIFPSKRHFLYSTFDRKVRQLVEGGFFVHWFDRYLSDSSLQKPEPKDSRVVLTMDHLSVGFSIFLGMLLIASLALTGELARVHLANYLRGFLIRIILRKHRRLSGSR